MAAGTSRTRRVPFAALLGVVAVAVAAAVVAATGLIGAGDDAKPSRAQAPSGQLRTLTGPASAPFTLNLPAGWVRVGQKTIDRADTKNAVAVRRTDGSAVVTVRVDGPVKQSLRSLQGELAVELKKRLPDAKIVESQTVRVGAGRALFTSWVNRGTANVQSNLVVPAGDRSYTLDAVFSAKQRKAAREVGLIFRAFDLRR